MTEGDPGGLCIDENTALDFVQGRLPRALVRDVDEHADGCRECRLLLDEAVRSFRDRATIDLPSGNALLTVFTRGDVLAARYRIKRFVARGGMGEVYEAEDMLLGTRLAIKTMNAAISDDPSAIRRLKQEVNLARRITHENVCRIFDIGIHEPSNPRPGERVLFLTMEFIEGISLGDRLRLGRAIPVSEARPIIEAMVAALGAAHRAGVVHRDFKSDNVMLSGSAADNAETSAEKGRDAGVRDGAAPRVVVMDFGLACDASPRARSGSQEGGLTGTLAYMAPEQLEGRATSPATDIYALGIVIFEMLAGRLPFEGEPPLGGALKRLMEEAPPLRALVPGVDPVWGALVGRCLEREAARRPSSADEIAAALRRAVAAPSMDDEGARADGRIAPDASAKGRGEGEWTSNGNGRKRRAALTAIAGALAIGAAFAIAFHRDGAAGVGSSEPSAPRTLATRPTATGRSSPDLPAADASPPATNNGRQATGGRARDRRAATRPAASDRASRRESSPAAPPVAQPPMPLAEEPSPTASRGGGDTRGSPHDHAPVNPRSLDPEDGFIFPR